MKNFYIKIIFLVFFLCCGSFRVIGQDILFHLLQQVIMPLPSIKMRKEIPQGLLALKRAYPNHIDRTEPNALLWKDGTKMIYNDGIAEKHPDTMLVYPDLEEMMRYTYPTGTWRGQPDSTYYAGRYRYEPFFSKMYGSTREAVMKNLTDVIWLPGILNQRIKANKVNGVAEKLQAISNELSKLPKEYHRYLKNIGGTFNWRTVSGSTRRSLHSFGIAIDLNPKLANYWDWDKNRGSALCYNNNFPIEIVRIFEQYGFIWGGKWWHYDTMHFEYRPELFEVLKLENE